MVRVRAGEPTQNPLTIQRSLVNAKPRGIIPSGLHYFPCIRVPFRMRRRVFPFSVFLLTAGIAGATPGVASARPETSPPNSPILRFSPFLC